MHEVRITFLGTGTSHGVPVLGCTCPVCTSTDERNKRYRSSILLEKDGVNIAIDTGYEFRLGAIRAGIKHLDAVLYTHSHSDHVMGLDDLRVFTRRKELPIYADNHTARELEKKFPYAFTSTFGYGLPCLEKHVIKAYEEFEVKGIKIMPLLLNHGCMEITGYRIGNFAYLTDVSSIPEKTYEYLKSLDVLVLGALRKKSHPTHFSFSEAKAEAEKIKPGICYFTHINHETDYNEINREYGPFCLSAYDNLTLEV